MTIFIIILICLLIFGGIWDIFFKLLGGVFKLILSIVLIIIGLIVAICFATPLMLVISIIALFVGAIWLIAALI